MEKAIIKMNRGKAAGPSGIVVEMLEACHMSSDQGVHMRYYMLMILCWLQRVWKN